MGSWGHEPTENDAALDWLDELYRHSELADRLETALYGDLVNDAEEIRCAAALIETLAKHGLWAGEGRGSIVALAVDRLQRMLDAGVYTHPAYIASIRQQINALGSVGCQSAMRWDWSPS